LQPSFIAIRNIFRVYGLIGLAKYSADCDWLLNDVWVFVQIFPFNPVPQHGGMAMLKAETCPHNSLI
jgi:hypothetical protein